MLKLNQKGFAGIEAILIAVVVLIAAGTGYYIYNANKKTNATLDTASKVAQSSPSAKKKKKKAAGSSVSATQKYVTITEWGVRAPYDGNLHLTYTFKHDTGDVTYATFTSSELSAQGGLCASDSSYGGIIERYSANENILSPAGEPMNQTATAYAATLQSSQYGHAGNYYFFYSQPQAVCSDSQGGQALQTQTMDAVKALLPQLAGVVYNR